MAAATALILAAALVLAMIDWASVVTDHSIIEAFVKPGVMVLLIAAVVVGGTSHIRWIVVAGLVASLLGDIALLERFDHFVAGLGAFLVAHLFFIAAFLAAPLDPSAWRVLSGLALVVVLGIAGVKIIRAARNEDERLALPVSSYVLVLSAMLIVASFGSVVAALGAAAFALSDAVLGWNRFVEPLHLKTTRSGTVSLGRVATHVLYHVGQWLLALWAIGL